MTKTAAQIAPELCSVVIQGPLYRRLAPNRGIESCIASIRQHLPGAEIVVSTWPTEDIEGLDADVIVVSDDPGPMHDCSGNILNTNRQLVSTSAGIRASTRPYVMKFRSDHNLVSSEIASLSEYAEVSPAGRIFIQPITVTNLFIRDPSRIPLLYHLSDLVMFGRREDMLKYWGGEVFKYEEIFNPSPRLNPFGNYYGYSAVKHNPEQALMIGLLQRHGIDVELQHPCEVTTRDLDLWESVLYCDFTVIDWEKSGVDFPERFKHNGYSMHTVYKASGIERVANLGRVGRLLRRAHVFINQYFLNCFRFQWWVAFATIVLYSASPLLARKVRHYWKIFRGTTHPNPEKNF